jgi:hypothetical protein
MEGCMDAAPEPQATPNPPPVSWSSGGISRSSWISDFINFRVLITPTIIRVVYALGAVLITLYSIYALAQQGVLAFLLTLLLGNLFWRIYSELIMLFFGMHEALRSIERQGRR